MHPFTTLRVASLAVAAVVLSGSAQPVRAHGVPLDLAFFGPFGAPTAHCLRVISGATQRCFRQVMQLQRRCLDQQLGGAGCDQQQRDANIGMATDAAHAAVTQACLGGQLTELRFNGFQEVLADVTRGCIDQAVAAMSMVTWPVDYTTPTLSAADQRACLAVAGEMGQKLVDLSAQRKTRALDRMAVRLIGPAGKRALLAAAAAQLAAARPKLAALILTDCPDFKTLFDESALDFLTRLAVRGDCIVNAAYIQTEVTCPPPVCGNGIQETGELCDDGNTIDNDRCRNDCTLPQ